MKHLQRIREETAAPLEKQPHESVPLQRETAGAKHTFSHPVVSVRKEFPEPPAANRAFQIVPAIQE